MLDFPRLKQISNHVLKTKKNLLSVAIVAISSLHLSAIAEEKTIIFSTDFESDANRWSLVYGADLDQSSAHSGTQSIKVENEASLRTKTAITESGTLEFWLRTNNQATNFSIKVFVNSSLSNDAGWNQVGVIEGTQHDSEYHAKRISIDEPGKKFLRLDVSSVGGIVNIDDVSVDKIMLATALQKNRQAMMDEVLNKLRDDNSVQVQAEMLKNLGKNYTAQIETQRQYIEYANGIYSSISLVLATSERSKMANPLGYATFKGIIDDVKKVSSPIQKTRMDSLMKPLGDITSATINVVTAGAYSTFVEPFKSLVATSFEKQSYENSGVNKEAQKFAEKNGLSIYQKTEKFLSEIEKELNKADALDKDLAQIQTDVDKYRKDLTRHLKDYLIYGGKEKTPENFNRVMSKDDQIRAAALKDINDGFSKAAEAVQSRSSNNAQLVEFMLKASNNIDEIQEYKERFNQITSAMLTFYEKFEKSIAPEQNPFSSPDDRKAWEMHAQKTREYIQQSKEAFKKAYL